MVSKPQNRPNGRLDPCTSGHLVEPEGSPARARRGPTVGPPGSRGQKNHFFQRCSYVTAKVCPILFTCVTAKICSHRRVRVEILTRTRWFFLCWKFVIFHAKFMCGVSPYPTQPLFALPLHHWVPLQTFADRRSPSPSAECPKNHTEFPKTLLSDCPLTRACWKCNAYALGAWRVRVGVSTRTRW